MSPHKNVMLSAVKHLSLRPFALLRVTAAMCQSFVVRFSQSQHRIPALPVQLCGAARLFEKFLPLPLRGQQLLDQLAARLGVLAVRLDVTGKKAHRLGRHAVMLLQTSHHLLTGLREATFQHS